MDNIERDDIESARNALLTDEAEAAQPDPDQAIYDLMDNDQEVRQAVKEEMKRRLFQQAQPAQAAEPAPQDDGYETKLEQVRKELEEHERWIDQFFATPGTERNYDEYERRREQARRLDRQERLMVSERDKMRASLLSANTVVDQWLRDQVQAEKRKYGGRSELERYAGRVREMAQQLPANVRADSAKLREALRHYVEPNAYKAYREQERYSNSMAQRGGVRRDSAGSGAYMDDGGEAPRKRGKYDDASADEQQFLRGLGLLQDERRTDSNEMIPTADGTGYIIPITRGRLNRKAGGEQ